MTDPATGQRSFLQALRVPFDLKGVAAGAMAFLAMTWGARLMGLGGGSLRVRMDSPFDSPLPVSVGADLTDGRFVALALAVAAVFGVACCRIAAVRLSRDEGTDLGASLGFSVSGLPATLGAYLFLAGALGLFFGSNALAGLVSGIPGIGPVLMVPLYPLVLLSTLILFLLAFGTALGLPLVLAGLAVERNGALDAVSRGFSYVFSRPALFFLYTATVWFLAWVLLASTAAMEWLAPHTFTHWFPEGESYRSLRGALDAAVAASTTLRFPDFGGVSGAAVLGGWAAWLFGTLLHVALRGYVAYYLFGGATAAYFALRRDVDGTEDEEIWMEGEQGEGFGEPERPAPADGVPGPSAPPPGGPPAKV